MVNVQILNINLSLISDNDIGFSCPFASLAQRQDWVSWATVSELANSHGLIFAVGHWAPLPTQHFT